jgi:hypothetical protein
LVDLLAATIADCQALDLTDEASQSVAVHDAADQHADETVI